VLTLIGNKFSRRDTKTQRKMRENTRVEDNCFNLIPVRFENFPSLIHWNVFSRTARAGYVVMNVSEVGRLKFALACAERGVAGLWLSTHIA
jgi:hypothetical protein